ncbi:MAG: XRE family transcriptional regulator [Clostridiales bacterium]|nr:XRE family transcriptional regulator [Clostridiales bacterium]
MVLLRSGKKRSQTRKLQDAADAIGVSFSAMKHWLMGHNAPSDLDKVRDLAQALHVEMNDLLDTDMEENKMNTNMNTNTMQIPTEMDNSSVLSTVRSLYRSMASYLELVRMASKTEEDEAQTTRFTVLYTTLYRELMLARLGLPEPVFAALRSFLENYLQPLMSFRVFERLAEEKDMFAAENMDTPDAYYEVFAEVFSPLSYVPWSAPLYTTVDMDSADFRAFETDARVQAKYAFDELGDRWDEILIRGAYTRLEQILKDYRMA